ncbi:MAG TPA: amidohydrolase family protein [Ilumatobacter sp.]|nr:amidohydrolase family protein [Ilumatobacter sp.]
MNEIPKIISVDDHVLEPPDLWTSRLPAKYQDAAPRIVRQRMKLVPGRGMGGWEPDDEGDVADVWYYQNVRSPLVLLSAAVGLGRLNYEVVTYDDVLPGTWRQADRLRDMDVNHVEASVCFPNTLPRFCGQTFAEQPDKELGLRCVQAYNDWMIEEWSAGDGHGRLIPLAILPLWDAELCAAEIRRNAERGCFAVTFPENPHPLGFPSIHDKHRYWDPVFAACQDTSTTLCMHIGSSSTTPTTAPDAPYIISSTLTFQNAMGSLCDYLFSGILVRFPALKIAYSEGQVGWMPYILERADKLWEERDDNSFGTFLPEPPSSYIAGRVYGCIFDDATGLRNREYVGMSQICFETDYPHADSTFPDSKRVLTDICAAAGLDGAETYALARGNAITAFGLERFGISS